ncbi:hypothetical protein KAFR_0E00130 [Kazachstania africana CBS 2517]|uniref:LysM domain-containing protein n=1 Tax=Kazachstania africana (strain ATCC 22294 / BCRC 22015 / CBS 2517 / CECT 1963 / NBRC 1671 / NRRL Y-8276) TaxID=1071382 RepID=H2AUW7_KAZAF|nr:hypothetical protein KAFR_0E00130 [Kazachstania africana CBS 2517]CCF58167.1 hypothetical protein KAFR_0E00130 [Kazachstania africana CBS 2517]
MLFCLALFFLIQTVFSELTLPDTIADVFPSSQANCSEGTFMMTHEWFAYWDGVLPNDTVADAAEFVAQLTRNPYGDAGNNQLYKLTDTGYTVAVFGGIQVNDYMEFLLTALGTYITNANGVNNYFYLESHTGDPKTTYGFIVAKEEYESYVDEAVKTWSMGKSYDLYNSTTQSIGNINICQQLAEEAYAPVNSADFGECISIFYDSSKTIEEQTGLTDDLLYVYNNGTVSFNDGDRVCISLGTASE